MPASNDPLTATFYPSLSYDDPMAAIDIPHFCRQKGHRLVDQTTEDAVLRFTIAKGE